MQAINFGQLMQTRLENQKLAAVLVAITSIVSFLFIYADVVNHVFLNWDDIIYVADNPYLHKLNLDNIVWMLSDYKTINWHPLTWFTYSLEFFLFGKNPTVLIINNIILHTLTIVVLFYVFRNILKSLALRSTNELSDDQSKEIIYTSAIASGLFAIHPQHVESIVWISERKDVLCNLFYYSSILCYINFRQNRSRFLYIATIICALLATMSKPMAVSLPLALIVLDIAVFSRIDNVTGLINKLIILLHDKIILILISIFIAFVTLLTQQAAIKDIEAVSIATRIVNASLATLHYLGTIILPVNLSPFYPFSDIALKPSIISLLPVMVVLALIYSCIMMWKKGNRLFPAAMLFYIVTVAPVIGIVTVGHQAYADRYTYIPTSLFYLAIVNLVIKNLNKSEISRLIKSAALIFLLGFYLILGYISSNHVNNWKNDESLWLAVIDKFPGKVYLAYQNLGNTYLSQRHYPEAISYYNSALLINAHSSKTHENIGRAYAGIGDKNNEIKHYLLAIDYDSNALWPKLFAGYFYLGNNDFVPASKYFKEALLVAPDSSSAIIANAKLEIITQNPIPAKKRLNDLLIQNPNQIDAIWLLAQMNYAENNYPRTKMLLSKLLELKTDHQPAKDLLARINK